MRSAIPSSGDALSRRLTDARFDVISHPQPLL
jgi:hypothetical protein